MKRSSHGSQYLYLSTLEAVPNDLTLSICFVKAERPLCSPFYLAVGLVGNVPHSIKVKAFLRLSSVCCNRIALHGKESILEVIITFHGVYPQCVKKVGSKGMESLPSFPTFPFEKRLSQTGKTYLLLLLFQTPFVKSRRENLSINI